MYNKIFGLFDKLRIIICKPWFLFHNLDVTSFKISVAMYRSLMRYSVNDRIKLKSDIIMSNSNHFFPIYSCRSGFDAILQILNTSPRSDDQPEIIMTGLNIKHMRMLPEIHGYKVKILDIDLDTMEPDLVQLKNLITPKTHILVVAQLCGVHVDLEPLARIVKENNIIIIEDCAQSINNEYFGSCHVDFTLFSFGLSKDYTAFGGGLLRVHNNEYRNSISNLLETYPIESQFNYLTTVTISAIKFILSSSIAVSLIHFIARQFGSNFENVLNKIGKEFNDQDDPSKLLAKFRKQCSTPHLSIIRDRIKEIYETPNCNKYQLERKIQGDYLTNQLLKIQMVKVVGNKQMTRRYWLFPILVKNRDKLLDQLNQNGFVATKTATTFGYIGLEEEENNCFKFREEVVYLPYFPHIPRIKIDEMVKLIKNFK